MIDPQELMDTCRKLVPRLVFVVAVIALVGCVSETVNQSRSDSIELDCGWTGPQGLTEMTRSEYEAWLRDEMPHTATGCELTDEQIRRVMESFESDQARQRRWEKYLESVDTMTEQRVIYREVSKDDFISPGELLYLCDSVEIWQVELNGIMDFLAEYQLAEPEYFDQIESTYSLSSETQKLQVWNSSLSIRCGG